MKKTETKKPSFGADAALAGLILAVGVMFPIQAAQFAERNLGRQMISTPILGGAQEDAAEDSREDAQEDVGSDTDENNVELGSIEKLPELVATVISSKDKAEAKKESENKNESAAMTTPSQTTKPTQSAQPTQATKPTQSAKPVQSAKPAGVTASTQPAQTVKPATQPTTSVEDTPVTEKPKPTYSGVIDLTKPVEPEEPKTTTHNEAASWGDDGDPETFWHGEDEETEQE